MALLTTDNTPRPGAPANCGANVEGYDSPEETARIAAKIKRAGINLRYIAMDEPLWFGHYYNGGNSGQPKPVGQGINPGIFQTARHRSKMRQMTRPAERPLRAP
jgi:hypothetical protein